MGRGEAVGRGERVGVEGVEGDVEGIGLGVEAGLTTMDAAGLAMPLPVATDATGLAGGFVRAGLAASESAALDRADGAASLPRSWLPRPPAQPASSVTRTRSTTARLITPIIHPKPTRRAFRLRGSRHVRPRCGRTMSDRCCDGWLVRPSAR